MYNDTSLLQCGVQERKIGREAVELAIEKIRTGSDPNSCNRMAQTALHVAAIWGALGVGQVLIEAGANVNARNMMGSSTPLHAAAMRDQIEFAKLLLNSGANPMARDDSGRMAWQCASSDELRTLLGGPSPILTNAVKGGDIQKVINVASQKPELLFMRDAAGDTPLTLALERKDFTIAKWLVQNPQASGFVNQYGSAGVTALHMAVQAENYDLVHMLLEAGAHPDVKEIRDNEYTSGRYEKVDAKTGKKEIVTDEHRSPLFLCVDNGNLAIAKLLIQEGCDIDARDGDGCTALYTALDDSDDEDSDDEAATSSKKRKVAEFLLSEGASPDIGNADIGMENTLLAWSASRRRLDHVELLLQHGADPNLPGKSGMHPLHMAARLGAVDIVKALLSKGADITAKTPSGNDILKIAESNKRTELLNYLKKEHASSFQ
eukprot:g4732.t1